MSAEWEIKARCKIDELTADLAAARAQLATVVAECDTTRAELRTFKEMDAGRVAGYEAHGAGVEQSANPNPHFGSLSDIADAWDTGWLLAAGNEARAQLATEQQSHREAVQAFARDLTELHVKYGEQLASENKRCESAALADEERDHFASDRDAWKARAEEWKRVGEYAAISALKDKCADTENAAGAMRRALEHCHYGINTWLYHTGLLKCVEAALAPDISTRVALQLDAAERLATSVKGVGMYHYCNTNAARHCAACEVNSALADYLAACSPDGKVST